MKQAASIPTTNDRGRPPGKDFEGEFLPPQAELPKCLQGKRTVGSAAIGYDILNRHGLSEFTFDADAASGRFVAVPIHEA
jgi:hypothetical protein